MQFWIVGLLIVVYLSWVGDGDPVDGAMTALEEISRGPRLTHSPANDVGLVEDAPQDLASESGYTLEQYALGRMLSSEEGRSDNRTQAAIAWCAVNEAARRGQTIAQLVTHAKNGAHSGYFGTQKDKDPSSPNFGNSDRYCSTALDPYDGECQIASQVLDGTIPDFTGGCQQYDRPAGEKNPDKVAANRIGAGAQLVAVDGVDAGLRFWRT